MIDVRPMTSEDVPAADAMWERAFGTMRAAYSLPSVPHDPESHQRRIRHSLGTDPGGSWVAVQDGRVVGLGQALIRGDVWLLSLLGVDPRCQNSGVGRQLLDRTLDYGDRSSPGIILASRDPRAVRRYALAGFSVHPAVAAWGPVRRGALEWPDGVREAGPEALDIVERVDGAVRGAARAVDIEFMLKEGSHLIVDRDRGFAVVEGASIKTISALDSLSAVRVLTAALSRLGPDDTISVNWITAGQQWAIQTILRAGGELHPVNCVMVRGWESPPPNYLPNGAFG
jgi:predicted N-acetyltransferase YhbS